LSTLSSASTDAQVLAAFDDAASYEEDGSVAKARGFITAATILLRRFPKRARTGANNEVELDPVTLREQIKDARVWLGGNAASSSDGGIIHTSFESFRT
jgi:hypothetical protein